MRNHFFSDTSRAGATQLKSAESLASLIKIQNILQNVFISGVGIHERSVYVL